MKVSRNERIQLQIGGNVGSFEYLAWADALVAATKDTISVHPLDQAGSPRQQIEFDFGIVPFASCAQQLQNHSIFATVDKRLISLWDIATSSLLDTVYDTSARTDAWSCFMWSPGSSTEFMTGSATGSIGLWDRRSCEQPVRSCLIPNRRISRILWSNQHEHTVLFAAGPDLLISLDMRMLSTTLTSPRSASESDGNVLAWMKTAHPIVDFSWRGSSSDVLLLCEDFSMQIADIHANSLSQPHRPKWAAPLHDCHPQSLHIHPSSPTVGVMICRDYDDQSRCLLLSLPPNPTDPLAGLDSMTVEEIGCIEEPILSGFWRDPMPLTTGAEHPREFLAVSSSGAVHLLHHGAQWKDSSRPSRYSHLSLKKTLGVAFALTGERLWAEQSPRDLLNTPLPASFSSSFSSSASGGASASSIFPGLRVGSNGINAGTMKAVVGPLRFRMLLGDEVRMLEMALKSRLLDGLMLMSINEFTRCIILECSLQTTPANSSNALGHARVLSYGQFMNFNVDQQIPAISVAITFPKKLNHFWQSPTVALENRSSRTLDMESLRAEVQADIQLIITDLSKSKTGGAMGSSSSTATTAGSSSLAPAATVVSPVPSTAKAFGSSRSVDYSSCFLFNIAKTIRDKIHAFCEKAQQQSLANSKSQTLTRESSESDDELFDNSSHHLHVSKKYRVPFPRLSIGVFNATGQLCLFGNAVLAVEEWRGLDRPCRGEAIDLLPSKLYQGTVDSSKEKEEEGKPSPQYQHLSFAHWQKAHLSVMAPDSANVSKVRIKAPEANIDSSHSNNSSVAAALFNASVDDGGGENVNGGDGGGEGESKPAGIVRVNSGEDYAVAMVEVASCDALSSIVGAAAAIAASTTPSTSATATVVGTAVPSPLTVRTAAVGANSSSPALTTRAAAAGKGAQYRNIFAVTATLLPKEWALAENYTFPSSALTGSERVQACHQNAAVVKDAVPHRRDLIQFWTLLGVALDVLDMGDDGSLADPLSWTSGALGHNLMIKLFQDIEQMGILTAAAAITIVGGLQRLLDICSWSDPQVCKRLEVVLMVCVQRLQQWNLSLISASLLKALFLSPSSPSASSSTLLTAVDNRKSMTLTLGHIWCLQTLCQVCDENEAKLIAVPGNQTQGNGNDGLAARNNNRKKLKTKSKRIGSKDISPLSPVVAGGSSSNKDNSNSQLGNLITNMPRRCGLNSLVCGVCQASVAHQLLVTVCVWCGHGGHDQHLQDWFEVVEECPMGCGCNCRSLPALPAANRDAANEEEVGVAKDASTHSSAHLTAEYVQAMNFGSNFNDPSDSWNT